jgi:hypothetical protein
LSSTGVPSSGTTLACVRWLPALSAGVGRFRRSFALVGLLVIVRGRPDTRAIAGGALGLLGVAVGLSKLPVFLHGVVLSVFPSNLARVVVALTIAAGAAATCLGLVIFTAALESPEDDIA